MEVLGHPAAEPFINCLVPIGWSQLASLLNHRLDRARGSLESPTVNEQAANVLRGEIRALKSLLDLPNEAARQMSALPDAPY